jgi:hypothetical protein
MASAIGRPVVVDMAKTELAIAKAQKWVLAESGPPLRDFAAVVRAVQSEKQASPRI